MAGITWAKLDTQTRVNVNTKFKILIPEEFGGGSIIAKYLGFGYYETKGKIYDLFNLILSMNGIGVKKPTVEISEQKVSEKRTNKVLNNYIDNAGSNLSLSKLKYPIKLINVHSTDSYETYKDKFSFIPPTWAGKNTKYSSLNFLISSYE